MIIIKIQCWKCAGGYVWSLCLAKGYPLEWNSLQKWLQSRTEGDIDLRSILLDLQMKLEHHPLRLKLNFNQLELKTEEKRVGRKRSSSSPEGSAVIERIEIATVKKRVHWPYIKIDKTPRFAYDVEQDLITAVGLQKKYSRILLNGGVFEADSDSDVDATVERVTLTEVAGNAKQPKENKWEGDLTVLSKCFDYRASQDVIDCFVSSKHLSSSTVTLLTDVQKIMANLSWKPASKELNFPSIQECLLSSKYLTIFHVYWTFIQLIEIHSQHYYLVNVIDVWLVKGL